MTTIKKINSSTRNGNINALLTLILKAFEKDDWSADSYLSSILTILTPQNESMTEAIHRLHVYSQLDEADSKRDVAVQRFFHLMKGYTYIMIDDLKQAAELVNSILSQYSLSIINESHGQESADIESMLQDLATDEVSAAIAQLQGGVEGINSITNAQQEFEVIALRQAEIETAHSTLQTATDIKKSILTEMNTNLIPYLNTMCKVNPDTYMEITGTVAGLISKSNETVVRQSSSES